ncbi:MULTISPECIES: hypothetical protein [Photobacterium]|uniref:Uncharacterized protein n=1 Tax=Photobacterium toruni TaxID=1935446 RepID=A0A1T4UK52_9GAMM|nr:MULTISPECIES: hypothetical protein [Photobacterium]MCD9516407.1 hypothetical protein [Photobacterium carnosum]SKA52976.1 hypothetical protein CZ814_03379 [Photobacterium toruni]
MKELNHLLNVDSGGFEIVTDGKAMDNNISEWFSNAEHTIADNPAWGHNLSPFHFITQTEDDAVMMEMAIFEKLPIDVKGLIIHSIRVSFPSLDEFSIEIQHKYGFYKQLLPLR